MHDMMYSLQVSGGREVAWDDVPGMSLCPKLVAAARAEDMEFFKPMNAYTRCKIDCVELEGGKLIDTKWLDVNKGDSSSPIYRSRLVGRALPFIVRE